MGERRYQKYSVMAAGAKLHALENGGNALAATNTHGHQSVATLDTLQLVQGFDGNQCTGGPNGVAQ
jgi:hypothetical protein